jgi:adenylosuccinate lyase
MIPNVLANRYASSGMANIWSAENKIVIERHLWIAVLKAQKDLGIDIPQAAIAAYEKALPNINLNSINEREKLTRHDVKARIE